MANSNVCSLKESELEDIIMKDLFGLGVYLSLRSFRYKYHLDEEARTYKIADGSEKRYLKVAGLQEYDKDGQKLIPIRIEENKYGGDVYFAMKFDHSLEQINIGLGIHNRDTCNGTPTFISRIINGNSLWPWADGEVIISKDQKEATLLYNGVETSLTAYAIRGLALKLYRAIFQGLDQKEGRITHRYPEYDSPNVIDCGGPRIALKGL